MGGFIKFSAFKSVKKMLAAYHLVGYDDNGNLKISFKDFLESLELDISTGGGTPIFVSGTTLPSVNNLGADLVKGDWALLEAGKSYTNIGGGNKIDTPVGRWSIAIFNGSSWVLRDLGEIPKLDVIDGFNSTDKTKAGSADNDRVLKEGIDASVKKDEIHVEIGKNKLNINDYIDNVSIDTFGGIAANLSGFRTSKPINVVGATHITISNPKKNSNTWVNDHRFRFVNEQGQFVEGSLGVISTLTDLPLTIEVNNPAYKGFQLTFKRDTDDLDSYNELQIEFGQVATSFEPYSEKITKIGGKAIGNADKEVLSKKDTIDLVNTKAEEINPNGKVLRAPAEDLITYEAISQERINNRGKGSGYYQYNTGVLTPSTGRKAITIDVRGLDLSKLAIDIVVNGSSGVAVAVFTDEQGNYLGYQERVQSGRVDYKKYKLAPHPSTAFINCGNFDNEPNPEIYTYTEEVVYKKPLFVGEAYTIEEIDQLLINKLKGKRLFNFGTSIAAGDGNFGIGYGEMIISRNGMLGTDFAKGGATMANNILDNNTIIGQLEIAIATGLIPDYVLFDGGTNDMVSSKGVQLGDISNGYSAELNLSTYCGAFEHFCKRVRTVWPKAIMIYVKPHKTSSRNEADQVSFFGKADLICKKWAVPIADIYNEGQLLAYLPEQIKLYTAPTESQPDGDRTHPNSLGYSDKYVPLIESKMKLFLPI